MKSQVAFMLLAFLYLASPLATVQAARYEGPSVVNEGQNWSIKCIYNPSLEKINWTRNGLMPEELSSGAITVSLPSPQGISQITAEEATDMHEGNYRCTSSGNESFHLTVKSVTKIKVLTAGDVPLTLECENRTSVNQSVEWQKEGVDVRTAFAGKEDIVKFNSDNGSIVISKDDDSAYGNYTCNTTSSGKAIYKVVQKPVALLSKSVSVVEGEKLHLICGGKHMVPGIKISWTFAGKNYNSSEGRVRLSRDEERGINRAVLNVDNIEMEDHGNVSCHISYDWADVAEDHFSEAHTLLRVKDKLAALWPFLGICAEVLVLCAIILIYEKKRNKAELEESDTDQSPDTKPTPNKDSDVRQRK